MSNQEIPQTIIDAYGYKAAKILCDALIEGLEEDYEQKLAPLLEPTLSLVYDYIFKFSIATSLTFESQIYNNSLVIEAAKFSLSKLQVFKGYFIASKADTMQENIVERWMRWEDIKDDIVQDSIVCYKAMDGIFNEPKDMYININYNCLRANSIRMGGDSFSSEFKSGKVVAINVDTKAIYKTEAEAFHSNSECEGPCAWRSFFEYRYITEDQLDACGAIAAQETL